MFYSYDRVIPTQYDSDGKMHILLGRTPSWILVQNLIQDGRVERQRYERELTWIERQARSTD